MNKAALEMKTLQVIDEYISNLEHYTFDQLLMKPSPESWSVGQVYIHVCMSAKGFFLKKADQCMTKEGAEQGKSKNWKGVLVFTIGMMPPVKIRMPEKIAVEPNQPQSKEQLIAKLNEIKELFSSYLGRIDGVDLSYRTKHPIFSYLNAAEWIMLCEMHFRHHEPQIGRIRSHYGW